MNYQMTKEELLAVLKKVGKADLSIPESVRLSIPNNKFIAPYLQSITDFAENCRGTKIPALPYSYFKMFYETGDRWYFEDSELGYFPRRGRMAAFSILSWLYEREEDLHELEDVLWAVCDEYTWAVPAHLKRGEGENAFVDKLEPGDFMVDLFASETADCLAETVFLHGERLPEIIRKRIAYLLEERIFARVLNDRFGWMTTTNNWAAVCAGSVGMAAIYAIEDDEHLAAVLERILPAFATFLSGFAADGSCLEGIGYWNYGFSYFVSFADLLYRRTKGELDMFADPFVKKVAGFQQKCYFPGGRTISFSDGGSRSTYQVGLTSYLSRKYSDLIIPPAANSQQDYNDDHCHRWSNILRNLVWAVDEVDDSKIEYTCHMLPAAQWYINNSKNGVGIAAKGGHNAEPHNHNDVGNFLVYMNGEEIISDLGSGEYTRQYFGEKRYTYFTCGSQGHSVPMIDGNTQKPGEDACAANVTVDESGIAMNIAPAYGLDYMPALNRTVCFDAEAGITTLTDAFRFADDAEHEVTERFITYGSVQLDGDRAVLRMNGATMSIRYDPAVFAPVITPACYAAHFGIYKHLFTVDFVAKATGKLTCAFQIIPDERMLKNAL